MDRQQAHDYAAYAQQQQQQQPPPQQQFGYPPQAQQFPGPPFGPPHPHLQQFPYHPHLQQQQQQQPQPQVLSHAPPHPHHLPPPPSAFAPHLPPPLVPPQFHAAGAPPPAAAPPSDPELHNRIDKLVEYSAKNGPDFEAMIRDKQQDNPDYAFLFGGEGHAYYRYKLYASTRVGSFNPNPQFAPHMLPGMKGDEYFWRLQMFYIILYKNHQMAMKAYMLSKIEKTEEKSLERREKILDRHEKELDAKSMALMEKLQEQQKSIEQSHISNNQAFQRVAQTVEELERRTRRVGMNESAIRRW